MNDERKDAGSDLKYQVGPTTTPDAEDAKVEVEWDDDTEVTLKVTCPKCQRVTRIRARHAVPGSEVHCSCGNFTIRLGGDDLRDVQRAADKLHRSLKDPFKKR